LRILGQKLFVEGLPIAEKFVPHISILEEKTGDTVNSSMGLG
jgi:hypothetical protein